TSDYGIMSRQKFQILFLALSIAGYGWLFLNYSHRIQDSWYVGCLFRTITGLPCPSCGTTRSLIALMHGHVTESLSINSLGIIVGMALFIFPAGILYDIIFKSNLFFRFYQTLEKIIRKPWVAIPGILLLLANWFLLIVKDQ